MTNADGDTLRVLVTGGEGQLGRSLAEVAIELGIDLVAPGRADLDITRPETIDDALERHRPHVVVNAAAYTAVDRAESEPDSAHAVNATGAGSVAHAAAQAGIPVIHVSTDYVFDGAKDAPYSETDATAPLNVYGRTKRDGELQVAAANPRHVIVRTAWVHSPHGNNFVKTMLRLARERDALTVVDDQHGHPTYAPHLAAMILEIAEQLVERGADAPSGIFHTAGEGATTWCGLAREVMACAERSGLPHAIIAPIATRDYPTPARRPLSTRLDQHRLAGAFGLALPDWRQGVAECVARLAGHATE